MYKGTHLVTVDYQAEDLIKFEIINNILYRIIQPFFYIDIYYMVGEYELELKGHERNVAHRVIICLFSFII